MIDGKSPESFLSSIKRRLKLETAACGGTAAGHCRCSDEQNADLQRFNEYSNGDRRNDVLSIKSIRKLNRIFEPHLQVQNYRSLSIAHLERDFSPHTRSPSSKMSISQSSTEISDRKDDIPSNNPYHLDFKSTESVNQWYKHILNELDSVSTLSSTKTQNSNGSDKSSTRTIAGDSAFGSSLNFSYGENLSRTDSFCALSDKNRDRHPKLDAQFSRACSELRNIGSNFDSSVENNFRGVGFKYQSTLNIPFVVDHNLSSRTEHCQTVEPKSSHTWPVEQCSGGIDDSFNAKYSTETSMSSLTSSIFPFTAGVSQSLNGIPSSGDENTPRDGVEYYWQKVDDVLISRPMRPGESKKKELVARRPIANFDIMNDKSFMEDRKSGKIFRRSTKNSVDHQSSATASSSTSSSNNFPAGTNSTPASSSSIRNVVAKIIKLAENEISTTKKLCLDNFRHMKMNVAGNGTVAPATSSKQFSKKNHKNSVINNLSSTSIYDEQLVPEHLLLCKFQKPSKTDDSVNMIDAGACENFKDVCTQTSICSMSRSASLTTCSLDGTLNDGANVACYSKSQPLTPRHCRHRSSVHDRTLTDRSSSASSSSSPSRSPAPVVAKKSFVVPTTSVVQKSTFYFERNRMPSVGSLLDGMERKPDDRLSSDDDLVCELNPVIGGHLNENQAKTRTLPVSDVNSLASCNIACNLDDKPKFDENFKRLWIDTHPAASSSSEVAYSKPLKSFNVTKSVASEDQKFEQTLFQSINSPLPDRKFISKFVKANLKKSNRRRTSDDNDFPLYDNFDAASNSSESIKLPDIRKLEHQKVPKIRESPLSNDSSSPLADSELSPIGDSHRFQADVFAPKAWMNKKSNLESNEHCLAASITKPATEFQYKNPEDYERECRMAKSYCNNHNESSIADTKTRDFCVVKSYAVSATNRHMALSTVHHQYNNNYNRKNDNYCSYSNNSNNDTNYSSNGSTVGGGDDHSSSTINVTTSANNSHVSSSLINNNKSRRLLNRRFTCVPVSPSRKGPSKLSATNNSCECCSFSPKVSAAFAKNDKFRSSKTGSLTNSLPVLHPLDLNLNSSKNCCATKIGAIKVTENGVVGGDRIKQHSIGLLSAEKTARQCCRWLKAAGFPQYAKMYEDKCFPVDVHTVKKDHEFLDADSLRALFRRLHVLNECARFRSTEEKYISQPFEEESDDDDEDQLPLSRRWKFVRKSRTWSRVVEDDLGDERRSSLAAPLTAATAVVSPNVARRVAFLAPQLNLNSGSSSKRIAPKEVVDSSNIVSPAENAKMPPNSLRLQRSHSERLKNKAKALVKRMDFRNGNGTVKKPENEKMSPPRRRVEKSTNSTLDENLLSATNLILDSPKLAPKNKWHAASHSNLPETTNNLLDDVFVYENDDVGGAAALRGNEISSRSFRAQNKTNGNCSYSFLRDLHNLASKEDCAKSPLNISVEYASDNRQVAFSPNGQTSYSRQQTPQSSSSDEENCLYWERRDSGVGSSLSRSPSFPQQRRVRWHSFQRQHYKYHGGFGKNIYKCTIIADDNDNNYNSRELAAENYRDFPVDCLSMRQFIAVQKFALLKLTALMEKYSPSSKSAVGVWQFGVQKLFKRIKNNDNRMLQDGRNTFGVSLCTMAQRTGQPLPQCILHAMKFLRKQSSDAVGLFRKSGVRSRIQSIRDHLEMCSSELDEFDSQQAYDVADTLKQYFRDLPEPLFTSKLSETFIAVFLTVPEYLRLEAVQKAILLLPDENREALHSLIYFLHDVSTFSEANHMTAQNLAVCFAPTLFHLSTRNLTTSPQRRRKTITGGVPNEKELNENRAAQCCLTMMIENYDKIFTVPKDVILRCNSTLIEHSDEPTNLEELGLPYGNYVTYLNGCIDALLKEHRDRWRGWVIEGSVDSVEISSKKIVDGHPLKLWRLWTDVEAPPKELLNRLLKERDFWDDDIVKWRVVRKISETCDIFQYVSNDMPPHPTRDFCILRKWLVDMFEIRGGCILIETSVNVPDAPQMGGVRGVVLASRYLIEPSGAGRSRINHIVRIDTKGRSKSWYNKVFGHIYANHMIRIRNSFRQIPDGPETKV